MGYKADFGRSEFSCERIGHKPDPTVSQKTYRFRLFKFLIRAWYYNNFAVQIAQARRSE